MKFISLIISAITLLSVFAVATPVLAVEAHGLGEENVSVEIVKDISSEVNITAPTETTVVNEPIYDPEIDTAIDPCEFCCDDDSVPYDNDVATLSSESEPFTETFLDFTVNGLSSDDTDFQELFDKSFFAIAGESYDITQNEFVYYVMQGSCTDGEFDYFGYIVKQRCFIEGSEGQYENIQIGSGILCVKKGSDGSYTKIANHRFSEIDSIEHAKNHVNDLTYNSNLNKIVAACCIQGLHNKLYLISPSQLQSTNNLSNLDSVLVSCKVASIDYNETRNSYVVGLSGATNRFAILDNNFDVVKVVGHSNLSTDADTYVDGVPQRKWVRQSCCADNLRIYSMCYYEDKNKSISHTIENKIRVFDWNGNYITTIRINVTNGVDKIYESENIFIDDDKVYLGFNCLRSRDIDYCSLNLSELMFHVQYCPDENIDAYIGKFDNGNASSLIIRGVNTPLLKQRISITGKNFLGWTAYRTEAKKWFYKSADGTSTGWYTEGQQPDGYVKYIYVDKQKVANTGYCGEHVLMCAQWEDTDKFYISFHSSATPKNIYYQDVTYGVATPLRTNTFTKENRSFQGWNAYWAEKNKWYYKNSSGDKGWYREGDQPVGYTKYLYADEQSVVGTAYAGGHIQMHALWNEFYVQFDSNCAIIENGNILAQKNFHYLKGNTNIVPFFSGGKINGESVQITGYHLYRKELNKWYYISADGTTKKWCYEGQQPAGYKLYVKAKPSSGNAYLGVTALPGEHLVLRAIWN